MIDVAVSIKERVSNVVSELPESCTYDDIIYRLYVMQKFDAGIADLNEGKILTEEQISLEHLINEE